jgi:hypothetical protein
MSLIFAMNRHDVKTDGGLPRGYKLGVSMWLMISGIHHHRTTGLNPVSQSPARVIEIAGCHLDVRNLEQSLHEVMIANGSAELLEGDREIGVLHLPRKSLFEAFSKPSWGIDVPDISRNKERSKEWEALDMVPMGVGDQQVAMHGLRSRSDQVLPEAMCTGTTVQHD